MNKRFRWILFVLAACMLLTACGDAAGSKQLIANKTGINVTAEELVNRYNALIDDGSLDLKPEDKVNVDEYGVSATMAVPNANYLVSFYCKAGDDICKFKDDERIPDNLFAFSMGSYSDMTALKIPEKMERILAEILYLSNRSMSYDSAVQQAATVVTGHNDNDRAWINCGNIDCFYDVSYMYPGSGLDSCFMRLAVKNAGMEYDLPRKGADNTPVLGLPAWYYEESLELQGRRANGSNFCIEEGWIYGEYLGDKAYLVKARAADLSDWTKLARTTPYYIQIKNGYIYYIDCSTENKFSLCRMRTSGSEVECLVDKLDKGSDSGASFAIMGDTIYYSANVGSRKERDKLQHLFCCDLDGKNVVEVLNKPVYCWQVFPDGILYQDDLDGESLHKCRLDGTEDEKLVQGPVYYSIYNGYQIYYTKPNAAGDGLNLWRCNADGSNREKVIDDPITVGEFILSDEYIFFVDMNDSLRVYRTDLDGNDLTLVVQQKYCRRLELFGDVLKYQVAEKKKGNAKANYFCLLDGSGRVEFKK